MGESPDTVRKTLTSTSAFATESMGAEGRTRSIRNCWFASASWARVSGLLNGALPCVEGGEMKRVATVELHVSVENARPGARHVRHRRVFALRGIGDVEGHVGIALVGIRRLLAVGVHEPAPGAAADGLPIVDRAGLEVVHDERARLIVGRVSRRIRREPRSAPAAPQLRPQFARPAVAQAHPAHPRRRVTLTRRSGRGISLWQPKARTATSPDFTSSAQATTRPAFVLTGCASGSAACCRRRS